MTLSQMSDFLLNLVQDIFPGETVMWAEQYSMQFPLPLITLKLKDMAAPRHPVNSIKDGIVCAYYECTKILEINRYMGSVKGSDGEIFGLENLAVDGLQRLLMFFQSDEGVEMCYLANVCIEGMGPVRDLSALDGTHYKYRAMQEYTVRFTLEYQNDKVSVHGQFSEENRKSNREPVGYFEKVEMEDAYE